MKLAKVTGTVTATRKDEKLIGCKLMLIQPITPDEKKDGSVLIAVDTVGCGVNDIVMFVTGTASRLAARKPDSPLDVSVVGIVDTISTQE